MLLAERSGTWDMPLRVSRVLILRARVRLSCTHHVDLAVRVPEVEEAAGHDGDRVLLVVDADKVGHYGVEESSLCRVAGTRGAMGDALHVYARGEV